MFGELLALNFDCLGSPSICVSSDETSKALKTTGWGFGWYPNDDYGASVVKDGMAKDSQTLLDTLKDGSSFRSTMFACKVKGVGRQYTQHDSQPFRRSFGGYDWLFLHNGQLDSTALEEAHSDTSGLFEPVGKTDSELAFCFLLGKFLESSAKALTDVDGYCYPGLSNSMPWGVPTLLSVTAGAWPSIMAKIQSLSFTHIESCLPKNLLCLSPI
jgi:predicted glutamine amidotransferase